MGRRKSFVALAEEAPMDVTDAAEVPPTRIPAAKCARRPDNPRPQQLAVDELANSIREFGQIQPSTVASRTAYLGHRPDHADAIGDAEWVVLAGNRRHAACVQAGKDELLVHVADDRVGEIIEVGIIENIQREPLLPVREAQELQQLHKRYGTTRVVGEKIGKSHVYVSQRLSLLELVPQLQAAVDEGKLKIADARELAKIPQTRQLERYKAGPPFKHTPPKVAATPPDGVVPGSPQTYAHADLDVGNGVSNAALPPSGDLAQGVPAGSEGNGVSTVARAGAGHDVGNAVSNTVTFSEGQQANSHGSGQVGNPVSNTAPRPSSLPRPSDLVALIRREYTDEQQEQVVRLLQGG